MSDTEAATTAPRRSQRDKKQVERFGSGAHPPSRPSRGGISVSGVQPDNTKKRKRAEDSDSDTPEPVSDLDDQDVEGEEEVEEPRKAKPKPKTASAAKAKPKVIKPKAPPQKKPKIPKVAPVKTGPKATKRTRRPKGGDTGEPFDAEKLVKDTHISGDNPLFSM
jgi:cohesin complex subunit SA-1/2